MIHRYTGPARPPLPGVPARDLTDEEWATAAIGRHLKL